LTTPINLNADPTPAIMACGGKAEPGPKLA
jgi:hypothetical protein